MAAIRWADKFHVTAPLLRVTTTVLRCTSPARLRFFEYCIASGTTVQTYINYAHEPADGQHTAAGHTDAFHSAPDQARARCTARALLFDWLYEAQHSTAVCTIQWRIWCRPGFYRATLYASVCPSVCLSHSCIASKRLKISSVFYARREA